MLPWPASSALVSTSNSRVQRLLNVLQLHVTLAKPTYMMIFTTN